MEPMGIGLGFWRGVGGLGMGLGFVWGVRAWALTSRVLDLDKVEVTCVLGMALAECYMQEILCPTPHLPKTPLR